MNISFKGNYTIPVDGAKFTAKVSKNSNNNVLSPVGDIKIAKKTAKILNKEKGVNCIAKGNKIVYSSPFNKDRDSKIMYMAAGILDRGSLNNLPFSEKLKIMVNILRGKVLKRKPPVKPKLKKSDLENVMLDFAILTALDKKPLADRQNK